MPIEHLKKEAEKITVNDWLHDYGLDIDDHLTAGEVEELVEAFWYDKKKFIEKSHLAGKKEAIEDIKKWIEKFKGCYADSQSSKYISKKILLNYLNTI